MAKEENVLSVRLSDELALEFTKICVTQNRTTSDMLRVMITQVIHENLSQPKNLEVLSLPRKPSEEEVISYIYRNWSDATPNQNWSDDTTKGYSKNLLMTCNFYQIEESYVNHCYGKMILAGIIPKK